MKKLILPRSESGNIHSLASQYGDRIIAFPKGSKYAVVLAAYYGGKGYTTHRTEEAAIAASRRNKGYSYEIIDADGNNYFVYMDRLIKE